MIDLIFGVENKNISYTVEDYNFNKVVYYYYK